MALMDRLERQQDFTETERELALYVLSHADEVTGMGIAELAEKSFTSNATIVRLCRKLGLKGYRDFRIELSREVERRRTDTRSVDVNQPFAPEDELDDIMHNIATLQREALETCYSTVPRLEVRRAALAIRRAGRVFVFGHGDSRISTLAFTNQLLKLGVHCVDADRFDENIAQASTSQPGDVVLVVSYSGTLLSQLQRPLDIFRSHRCKVILVSSAEKPTGVDIACTFPARESVEDNIATFYSQECLRFVLNCIYAQLYSFDYEKYHELKARTDALISQKLS